MSAIFWTSKKDLMGTKDSRIYVAQACLGIHSLQIELQSDFPSDFPHIKIKVSLHLQVCSIVHFQLCTV